MDLTKLIGHIGSTAQAILPAQLQVRYLQRLQIQALKLSKCYHAKVHLDKDTKDELFWWIENLRHYKGSPLFCLQPTCAYQQMHQPKGGGHMSRDINRWIMVTGGTESSHQHTRGLKAVHLAILTFTKFQIVQRIHVQMNNKIALSYLVKMVGHSQQRPSWSFQTNIGLSAVKKDHNHCRVPTRSFECDSRLGVPQFSRQERLESLPRIICKDLSEIKYSQYRPFCIPDVSSTPSLHGLEARSGKSDNQCHVSTMDKNVPICLSPIQLNTPGITKGKERRDHNDISGTNMAITSMVFSSSEHVYPQSIFITTSERPTSGPLRNTSSFSSKPNSNTGRLVGFRK